MMCFGSELLRVFELWDYYRYYVLFYIYLQDDSTVAWHSSLLGIMKTSTILLTTTMCVLATATSLPSSETLATSDIWTGLNLNKCLVNAEVIPHAK